jgi:hypothetical protein
MQDTGLPEITEVQRLRLEPGDRLVIRCESRLDMATGQRIKEHARAALKLGDDFPVMVLGDGIDVDVVSVTP